MSLNEEIDVYGPCTAKFELSIDKTNELLEVLGTFSRDFAMGTNTKVLFEGLLSNFLKLTNSEYGFIGDRLVRKDGAPYLKTKAITNIAWDEATLAFYEQNAPTGMEFDNLESLFGHVIRTGRPLISNAPGTDPRAGGLPSGHPSLNSFLGVPLFLGDRYLGMAGVANRPGGYDTELLRYIDPLIGTTVALVHAVRMDRVASTDSLTGLANRRKFEERFMIENSRHTRHGNSLSLMLLDIDHFKSINDTFGHLEGDRYLIKVAEILTTNVRAEDLVARFGGDEFAVLLPDTTAGEAMVAAEHLRQTLAGRKITTAEAQASLTCTASVGVASLEGKENSGFDALLQRADKSLYDAKSRGRNQVCSTSLKPGERGSVHYEN